MVRIETLWQLNLLMNLFIIVVFLHGRFLFDDIQTTVVTVLCSLIITIIIKTVSLFYANIYLFLFFGDNQTLIKKATKWSKSH